MSRESQVADIDKGQYRRYDKGRYHRSGDGSILSPICSDNECGRRCEKPDIASHGSVFA